MEELKKITIDAATPVLKTENKKKKKFQWKFVGIPLGVLALLVVIIGVMLLPLRGVITKAKEMTVVGQAAMQAVKDKDLALVKTKLNETRTKLTELQVEYKKVLPLKYVPLLGAYIADGEHGINAGFAALSAGDRAIEAIEPNADLLGLKGTNKTSFLSGTAEERLQFAVKTMSALLPKINEMAASVATMQKELNAIDPNRYPEKIGKTVVRSKMVGGFAVINEMGNLFVNAQPLLMNLPSLLGDPADKRYLVIFQNDKELRSTGGFITAYAQFRMVKGKPILEKADDIYALDAALTKKFAAPKEILTFHKGVYNLNIRDSNLSPDFKVSMQQFMEMYNTTSGKEKIDGVLAVDTHVLVEMLKVLGPINVYGREFSAVIDKRCDCPKAVYELEDYSTRPVGYVREARKDIIGVLLQEILRMALGVSPSKYWGNLFQVLIAEINQKHVLAYFMDTTTQKAAEDFNMAGRVMTASESAAILKYQEGNGWDYLYVVNSNMAGAKSNMFVSSKVTKDTVVSGNTMTTKLTIDYKNPYPGSDCGLESGGLCLNAPLRNWVRVYTPAGSTLSESKGGISPKDGQAAGFETLQSLGKTMFEGFLIINPMGTAKLELTYTSPVAVSGSYKLLIQKQGGTDGDEYILKVNGKQKKDLPLVGDTEFVF